MRVGRDNIVYWRVGRCSSQVCVFVRAVKRVHVVGSSDSVAVDGPLVRFSGWVVATGVSSGVLSELEFSAQSGRLIQCISCATRSLWWLLLPFDRSGC